MLHLNAIEADVMAAQAPASLPVGKFLAAGAAILTAGALAAGPVAPYVSSPALSHRAVELTAIASPTASPFTVYPQIFTNTFTNLKNFGQAFSANPFPVLNQVISNQTAYGKDLFSAVEAIPANWKKFSEGTGTGTSGGATYLANLKKALAEGNTGAATTAASSYALYGMLATLQPIYGKLLTSTPRGSSTPVPGIPQKIAQNFANAVGVIFSNTTWVNGIVESLYGASSGTVFAVGEAVGAITKAAQAGNVGAAVNGLINLPGIAVDAMVNGWKHPAGQVSWPALLTYQDTGLRPTTSIGLLGQLGVKIPAAIDKAITPVVPTPTAAVAAAAAVESSSAATESVQSDAPAAPTAAAQTVASVGEAPAAVTAPAVVAPAAIDAVTVADEAPSVAASAGTGRGRGAAPAAVAPAGDDSAPAATSSSGTRKAASGALQSRARASASNGSSDSK